MADRKRFGAMFRRFREKDGSIQEVWATKLAAFDPMLTYTRSQISRIENGNRSVTGPEKVLRLVEAMVSFGVLRSYQDSKKWLGYADCEPLTDEEWIRLLSEREPAIGIDIFPDQPRFAHGPCLAPVLPRYFVPRSQVSRRLKSRLLDAEPASGVLDVCAIHGVAGLGKSTLVASLAHDPEVRERYPDGVLWAELGQEPDVLSLLVNWQHEGLNDYEPGFTSVNDAAVHLRKQLKDKAALLIVDNAWKPDHVIPFMGGGPHCRMLITTRRADVAAEVGADLYTLDVMTELEARDLFAVYLRRTLTGKEQTKAEQVARAVGYLPLALVLAAGRVARRTTSWDDLLKGLEKEIARLEVLEDPHRRRTGRLRIDASLNLSLNALRSESEDVWQAFTWLGVVQDQANVTAPMAATLWETSEQDAIEILELLWNDSLILPSAAVRIATREWLGYRVHDVVHDMARRLLIAPSVREPEGNMAGLNLTLPEAHAIFLERYRARIKDSLWHTLPDDGYIHAHLTWHMEQAGWEEETHALIREETGDGQNGWYEARERLGQTLGYLADIRRAWRLSEAQLATGLQCRYALVLASVNSLAAAIPPALMAALVEKGVWTPAQGLAYARQTPHPVKRFEALRSLAKMQDSSKQKAELLVEAAAAGQEVEPNKWLFDSLNELARFLAEMGYLQEALSIARRFREQAKRVEALFQLAQWLAIFGHPHEAIEVIGEWPKAHNLLSQSIRDDGLINIATHLFEQGNYKELAMVAGEIWDQWQRNHWRAKAQETEACYLARSNRLQEAVTLAQEIPVDWCRAEALSQLVQCIVRADDLERALVTARELPETDGWGGNPRAAAIAGLAPRMADAGNREKALALVKETQDDKQKARVLNELIPYLPGESMHLALEIPREIQSPYWRVTALSGLISHFPRKERIEIAELALSAAQEIDDEVERASRLLLLAQSLPEERPVLQQVLVSARKISDKHLCAKTLADLSRILAKHGSSREALQLVKEISDKKLGVKVTIELVSYLPEDDKYRILEDTLAAVRETDDDRWCGSVRADLAVHFSKLGFSHRALGIAGEIADRELRIRTLTQLASVLPKKERSQAIQEILTLERDIHAGDPVALSCALLDIALQMPAAVQPNLFDQALKEAREIGHTLRQFEALAKIAKHLSPNERTQALREPLASVLSNWRKDFYTRSLPDIGPHLTEPLLQQVMVDLRNLCKQQESNIFGADYLSRLAPYLHTEALLGEALRAARYLPGGTSEFGPNPLLEAIDALAPYLTPDLLQKGLSIIVSIGDAADRAKTMVGFSYLVAGEQLTEAVQEILAVLNETERAKGLAKDLSEWSSYVPEPVRSYALQNAQLAAVESIHSRYARWARACVESLAILASYMQEPKRTWALRELLSDVQELPEREHWLFSPRVDGLAGLVTLLPNSLRLEALMDVRKIRDEKVRAEALREIVPHIPVESMQYALEIALKIEDRQARASNSRFGFRLDICKDFAYTWGQ